MNWRAKRFDILLFFGINHVAFAQRRKWRFVKSIILYVHTHFRQQRSVLRYPFFKWRGENVFRAEKAYAIV